MSNYGEFDPFIKEDTMPHQTIKRCSFFNAAEKNGLERSNWCHWQQAKREVNSIYQASK
jgi:hypothetical protein